MTFILQKIKEGNFMIYYVTLDKDGWVTNTPATEQATDNSLTAVEVPVTSIQYFLRYPDKYRVVNGQLQAPANLPDLDIDSLKTLIDQQSKQIESLQSGNQDLQKALGDATQAQVQAQQQFTSTTQTFQTQFGDLTKQLVDLTKQVLALQPSK